MEFRYWVKSNGSTTVRYVDRVVYNRGGAIEIRELIEDKMVWSTLILGKNYRAFSISKE